MKNNNKEMQTQIEAMYNKEMFYQRIMRNKSLASIIFNITKDIVDEVFSESFVIQKIYKKSKSMTDFIFLIYQQLQEEKGKKEFKKIYNREAFIKNFGEGKNSFDLNVYFDFGNQMQEWIKISISLVMHPKSGDVLGFSYAESIGGQLLTEKAIDIISKNDYDFMFCIDANNGKYVSLEDASLENQSNIMYDYDYSLDRYIAVNVLIEDRERATKAMEMSNVLNQLQISKEYTVYLSEINKEKADKKKIKYTWFDEKNNIVMMTCMDISDIYEEKEKFIRKMRGELENEKANAQVKNEYVSEIFHELRTPANVIVGLLDTMDDLDIEEERKSTLSNIKVSSKHLKDLLRDSFEMTKLGGSEISLLEEEFYVMELLEDVANIMEAKAKKKKIDFVLNFEKDMVDICIGDPTKLRQVLLNLISNGVKYTPEGGKVVFSARKEKKNNKYRLFFSVADTGDGISEEFLSEIFKPFTRESKYKNIEGNGLGLTICKNLIDLMNGTISINSEKNKGTEVLVTVDLLQREVTQEKAITIKGSDLFAGKRILVVDDHELNIEVAKRILIRKGFEVEVAVNGKLAVEKFNDSEDEYFDGILMDIRMPIMDGFEATKKIRELDRKDSKKIPIVAMTANAFDENIELAKKMGMNVHLTKPINPSLLYDTLEKLV